MLFQHGELKQVLPHSLKGYRFQSSNRRNCADPNSASTKCPGLGQQLQFFELLNSCMTLACAQSTYCNLIYVCVCCLQICCQCACAHCSRCTCYFTISVSDKFMSLHMLCLNPKLFREMWLGGGFEGCVAGV